MFRKPQLRFLNSKKTVDRSPERPPSIKQINPHPKATTDATIVSCQPRDIESESTTSTADRRGSSESELLSTPRESYITESTPATSIQRTDAASLLDPTVAAEELPTKDSTPATPIPEGNTSDENLDQESWSHESSLVQQPEAYTVCKDRKFNYLSVFVFRY